MQIFLKINISYFIIFINILFHVYVQQNNLTCIKVRIIIQYYTIRL